ncbi:glycogen/starch/alpha-glucan family phosphorylase [Erysipelotrichaceae bacterium OH741_COT-311]|nr:glycogen/starch/alpha-glucan family phosphorylase [Erysipelotrichaceae bacterium OH741_COT-311]
MNLETNLLKHLNKPISEASNQELYDATLNLVKEYTLNKKPIEGNRKLYYISAEFLIGKLLSNNLINLGIYDELKTVLQSNNKNITEIEELEQEPSLGNGGLGRLASCFIDSIATLGLNGDGVGLNYHFGLFKQQFKQGLQHEIKNEWMTPKSWLNKTDVSFQVQLADKVVTANMYDIDVIGYDNGVNKLHLFDLANVDETLVHDQSISFDKENFEKNLTLFLYPDDSDEAGHLLRIYQQYFMVSSAAQLIIKEEKEKGHNLRDLHKHVVVQINDTHPSLVIPELIRLLMQEGIRMKEAIDIVSNTTCYTNHTILSEALEKWPRSYLQKVVPHLMPIIEALDSLVAYIFSNPDVQIIDEQDRVHMARIDMHYGYSINGVAALHTDILKNSELKPFYDIYPDKFNNKTNGITFRRWLMHCNPELANYITSLIGEGWKKDANELEKLLAYYDNQEVLDHLYDIKQNNKRKLASYIQKHENIELDPNSIFCIQIKRIHEYKRQQMNALYIIYKYLEIKNGNLPKRPITILFGGKAAPAYYIAKDIIHLIITLSKLINNDPVVSKYLKVVMVENYNVTYAEQLIPACDISEQISLASKEASGTGNMKFMLNGAITLGTMDGANVEIAQLVGNDNIYTFGESSQQVIDHYNHHDYSSKTLYQQDELIKKLVDFIVSDELLQLGSKEHLQALHNELINKDWFMTLLDVKNYIETKEHVFDEYENTEKWKRMSLVNTAKAGFFSSDRTINDYNQDIWKLK